MKRGLIQIIISLYILVLLPLPASAVMLNVVGGQLTGAFGVDVNGTSYDVVFRNDGTCREVYSECDEISDFAFGGTQSAQAASRALSEQVFTDNSFGAFDSNPGLVIGGRSSSIISQIWTPYSLGSGNQVFVGVFGNNTIQEGFWPLGDINGEDGVYSTGWVTWEAPRYMEGSTEWGPNVWAVWTEVASVPEPNSWLLMGSGLVVLGWNLRKMKASVES